MAKVIILTFCGVSLKNNNLLVMPYDPIGSQGINNIGFWEDRVGAK